jgi:hypothetical protein
MSISDRVRRGIALLDEEKPGWPDQVDVAKLDMQNPRYCVLGQMFGRYSTGQRALPGIRYRTEAVARGFDATLFEHAEYRTLARLWSYAITSRTGMRQ